MAFSLLSTEANIEGPSFAFRAGRASIFTCNDELLMSCVTSAVDGHLYKVVPPTICVVPNTNEISRVNRCGRWHMCNLVLNEASPCIRRVFTVAAVVLQPTAAAVRSAGPSPAANV